MVRPDYTVRLREVFQGPMDLLLHLVREQEVEIHEVEISRVIDGYFEYLKQLEDLDIEVAGDFLVMAATLMAIKSRSLLPREEVELEDELDPEDELIQRLVEYRRFKGAADDLGTMHQEQSRRRPRGYRREVDDNEPDRTLDLGELTAWDLLATFSRLMRETLANRPHHIRGNARPLRWYVHELGRAIQTRSRQTLREFLTQLEDQPSKEGLIGAFCALLELVHMGFVSAVQESNEDEIEVVLVNDPGEDLDRLISASRLMDEEEPETDDGLEPAAATETEPQGEAAEDAVGPTDGDALEAPAEASETPADGLDDVPPDMPGDLPGGAHGAAHGRAPRRDEPARRRERDPERRRLARFSGRRARPPRPATPYSSPPRVGLPAPACFVPHPRTRPHRKDRR